MAVTIRDVADEARVSVATVSRVFNRKGQVRDETRLHVLEVADRLGYIPNPTARSLSRGWTNAIGVILPVPHGEFFSEIIRGLDEAAQESDFHLLISSSHNRLEETEAALKVMIGRVDGLVIMSPHFDAQTLLKRVRISSPAVFVSSAVENVLSDAFVVENYQGGRAAVQHLIELGHRRIAAIKGPDQNLEVQERLRGYRAALQAAGLPHDPALELEGDFTQETGYAAGRRVAEMDDRPSAVFAFNDYMAIGVLSALQQAGVRVPEDMAVIGFDDIFFEELRLPVVTTVFLAGVLVLSDLSPTGAVHAAAGNQARLRAACQRILNRR